jgi:hypothetical protein
MSFLKDLEYTERSGGTSNDVIGTSIYYRAYHPAYTPAVVAVENLLHTKDVTSYRGQSIKGFRRLVNEGKLLPHTKWWKFTNQGSGFGSVDIRYGTDCSKATHDWTVGNRPVQTRWVISEEELYNYVPSSHKVYLQKAAAKVYSSGHDTLTFIAELSQLKSLFKTTALKLIKMDFPRNWKALTCDWLSARYGWRPLFGDIVNLNKAVREASKKIQRTRFSERAGTTNSFTNYTTVNTTDSRYTLHHYVTDVITVGIRGSVTADIKLSNFQFNPIQTAWELTTLSFVVDWFIGIGQAISALSFLAFQTAYTGSSGYQIRIERKYSTALTPTSNYCVGNVSYSGQSVATLESREPGIVPVTPPLLIRLDAFKIVDLLALVYQRKR